MKKVLSLLLSVLMVATTLPFSSVTALAADSSAFKKYDVTIAVPETVYMKPQSLYTTKGTQVQYYVNNTVDSSGKFTTDNSRDDTMGKFAVYGDDVESVDSVSIDGATLSGFDVTKDGKLNYDDEFTFELTDGISSEQTKTLEWTITCTMKDGTSAELKAYTLAYAPYLAPVAGSVRTQNECGKDTYCQMLSYISGIHGLAGAEGSYYSRSNFLPMVYIKEGSGTEPVLNFISSTQTCGLPEKTITYINFDPDTSSGFWNWEYAEGQDVSPLAGIMVDISRYSNLNQIPNLTLGVSITDTENNEYTYGYFGEFDPENSAWKNEDGTPKQGGYHTNHAYGTTDYENTTYRKCDKIEKFFFGSNDNMELTTSTMLLTSGDSAFLKTGVLWDKEIETGSNTYYTVAGARAFQDMDNAVAVVITRLNVSTVDKSSLRDAVKRYESYGLQRDWFGNRTLKTLYDNYQAELKDAAARLGDPTNTDTSHILLDEAYNRLLSQVHIDNGYYNITANQVGADTYKLSAELADNTPDQTVEYEYVLRNNLLHNGNFGSSDGWYGNTENIVNDGLERGNAFCTSYKSTTISQAVSLTDYFEEKELNKGDILLDLGGEVYNLVAYGKKATDAKLYVEILDGAGKIIKTVYALDNDTTTDGLHYIYFTLPANARSLQVFCVGQDGLNWRGNYGPRFDNVYICEAGDEYVTLSDDNTFELDKFNVDVSAKYTVTKQYSVNWVIGEETVETDSGVNAGTTPKFDGEIPADYTDGEYLYRFLGWSDGTNTYAADELPAVTADVTYTAVIAPFKYVEKAEPYIDEDGAYIVGNVAYYTDENGNAYAVNEDNTVGDKLDSVELSYFDFADLSNGTCQILRYNGSYEDLENGELVIPKTYNGKKITVLGDGVNSRATFMPQTTGKKSQFVLVLNENIEEIKPYAFYALWVTKVQGDTSSLKIIGKYAFSWANSPDGYTLDIQLDYPGRISMGGGMFNNMIVTARIKHSTTFSRTDLSQQDLTYVFTDAHTYGEPEWTWVDNNNNKSATATFICTGSPYQHQEDVEASVSHVDEDGMRTYTATVEFEGETYTDTKVTEIPLDTDAYYAALDEANAIKETDLTQYEDYETFLAEIDGAEADFAAATTQAEVDAATRRIITAIENLKKGYIEPEFKGTCNIVGLDGVLIQTNNEAVYEAEYNEKVYLLGPADTKFAYTNEDGSEIYAYLVSDVLYAPTNNVIYIKAVSSITEGKAYIAGTSFDTETHKAKYNCQYSIPDDATFVETGIVLSFDKATTLEIGADGARAFKAQKIGSQHEYSITFNISDGNMGKTIYGKSYLTYTLNGETITVYSEQHNIQLKED